MYDNHAANVTKKPFSTKDRTGKLMKEKKLLYPMQRYKKRRTRKSAPHGILQKNVSDCKFNKLFGLIALRFAFSLRLNAFDYRLDM
jgi:hypothetical protein